MIIQFKTQHLAFLASLAWKVIPFKLQIQLYNLVSSNNDPNAMHSVDISAADLLSCYSFLSKQEEGLATEINNEVSKMLQPQLFGLAGMTPEQVMTLFAERAAIIQNATIENPHTLDPLSEPLTAIQGIMTLQAQNDAARERIISNGMKLLTGKL